MIIVSGLKYNLGMPLENESWGCVVELVKGQSHTEKAQKRSWVRVSTRTILCKMQTVVQAEPRYYTAE